MTRTWLLAVGLAWGMEAQPAITSDSAPPVVPQGTAHTFTATCRGTCEWSLVAGSVGTMDISGVYHAPAKVTVNSSIAGCQLYPPDHGYNARADGLPVRAESAAWVQLLLNPGRMLTLGQDMPWNPMDSTTPAYNITPFAYTTANNAPPKAPYQVAALPAMKLQSGYYYAGEGDHHYIGVRPDTCMVTELYAYGAQPFPYGGPASSGVRYPAMTTALPSYWGGATDAAGTFLLSNILRFTEVTKAIADGSNVVKHAIRITLLNYSQLGSPVPDWPASSVAVSATGRIPYGGRFRLKQSGCVAAGLLNASCQYTGSNPATRVLVNTLQQYGLIAADGGASMDASLDNDAPSPELRDALLKELPGMGLNLLRNLEAVDTRALAPANQNAIDGGLVDPAKVQAIAGYTPPQYAQAVVRDSFDGSTAAIRIALQGGALDVERNVYAFQAGADAYRIPYYISGVTDASVTWTMSPALGTLDAATGTYTPPATLSAPAATVLTVRSNADATLVTQVRVVVLPSGVLGLLPAAPGNYTDTSGQKWWAVSQATDYPVSNVGITPPSLYNDGPANSPDSYLYVYGYHPRSDLWLELRVPNGSYKVTVKMLTSPNHWREHLEAQGQIVYNDLDPYTLAGGVGGQAVDLGMPAQVSDGWLRIYARRRDQYGGVGGDTATGMGGVLIEPAADHTPRLTINPVPTLLTPSQTQQFYCVRWYLSGGCTWTLASGPGSITAGGLYTAPATGYDPAAAVTVTATSTVSSGVTASLTFNLGFGTMTVTPANVTLDRGLSVSPQVQINGIAYGNVRWSRTPAVGTIDAVTGVYTAPETVAADTQVTVTATSMDNAAHSVWTTVTVRKTMPAIHIAPGMDNPGTVTDTAGNVWTLGTQYYTCTGGSCYPGADTDHSIPLPAASSAYPPNLELSSKTKLIWDGVQRGSAYVPPPQNDFQYLFPVPNGTYQVMLGFMTRANAVVNLVKQDVWVNGVKWLSGWDSAVNCGSSSACSPPVYTVTVSNHQILIQFKGAYTGRLAGNVYGGVPSITAIQIYDTGVAPPQTNPPLCSAGSPQTFRAGYPAHLDGSGSAARDGGTSLRYLWQQLSGPTRVRWSSRAVAQPAISLLTAGSYEFQLTVTDSHGQASVCTVKDGAVATDDNGVVITNQPALDALLGPLTRIGNNPWPWFDDRQQAAAGLEMAALDANYPAWWDVAGSGTVGTVAGSRTVTGNNTTFTTTFCQGPGNPSVAKSGAAIAVWYHPGAGTQTGRRMLGATGCIDDTHLTVDDAWDASVGAAESGLSYAATDASTGWAANWGWGSAEVTGNYSDNVAAYYALYYRTGNDEYLAAARKLADRAWSSPMIDQGRAQMTGHQGSYGYAARSVSALGLVLRARELEDTEVDMWPGLRHLWDLSMGALSGVDRSRGPGMWDTREEAYHLAMAAYCALFDPDAAYRMNCKTAVANSFGAVWTPSMGADGSWGQLFATRSSWDTATSAMLTPGSAQVVGNGTAWSAADFPATIWFTNGALAKPANNLAGDAVVYTATFVDATHLTLDRTYQGTSGMHGWALVPGTAMVGWGEQTLGMGLLASAFDLAAKAIADTAPVQAGFARNDNVLAANWLRLYGQWASTKGLYTAVGGLNCQPPVADSNTACTGGLTASDARALSADALRGLMTAYAANQDTRLRDTADGLYNAMFAKTGTCPAGSALCVPDGLYAQGLDDGGSLMTATPPNGPAWFGRLFGFNNLAAWPAYRAGGAQPANPRTGYVGFNLSGVRGATTARITVTAPNGNVSTVDCTNSPCPVTIDARQGKHLVQLQYLGPNGLPVATTEIPM